MKNDKQYVLFAISGEPFPPEVLDLLKKQKSSHLFSLEVCRGQKFSVAGEPLQEFGMSGIEHGVSTQNHDRVLTLKGVGMTDLDSVVNLLTKVISYEQVNSSKNNTE